MAARPTQVILEVSKRRAFAVAADWPGWCRAGRDPDAALAALADYADRYAPVAQRAGVTFRPALADQFTVIEELAGDGTTEFGAPGQVAEWDRQPLTAPAARRRADLVAAAWAAFDEVVAGAPEALRKGPRGGGRDRDKIVEHVLGAEASYARKLGLKIPAPAGLAEADRLRSPIRDVLRGRSDGSPVTEHGWPPRYAAHRIAWHVLDHAWEIEDKSQT